MTVRQPGIRELRLKTEPEGPGGMTILGPWGGLEKMPVGVPDSFHWPRGRDMTYTRPIRFYHEGIKTLSRQTHRQQMSRLKSRDHPDTDTARTCLVLLLPEIYFCSDFPGLCDRSPSIPCPLDGRDEG